MGDVTGTFYPAEAFIGYGTEVQVGNGASPEEFESVAFVVSFTPGKMQTDVVEVTHLRSPAAHKEKLPAMRDSAAFTMMCNYWPKDQSQSRAGGGAGAFETGGLLAMWIDRKPRNLRMIAPDGSPATVYPFRGCVTGYTPGGFEAGKAVDLTVEITPLEDFSSNLP